MQRFMPVVVSAAVAVLAAAAAHAAPRPAPHRAAAPGPAACALGTGKAAELAAARAVIAAEGARFARSLPGGTPASQRRAAGAVFANAAAAYLYGYPQVMLERTVATYPRNAMVSIGKLADTSTVSVVAPNHDTLYSVAHLDLSAGPMVIRTPPTGGRYSVLQLTDAFTDVAGYLGDGARARSGDAALVVPPGWTGTVPAGLRLIRPASSSLWLLGRTLATGAADTAAAVDLLKGYSVAPLADDQAGARKGPLVLADFPKGRKPVTAPQGIAFLDELGADLVADPAPARDACALRAFAAAGIGPGRTPSTATGLTGRALRAAAAAGPRVLTAYTTAARHAPGMLSHGWTVTPADTARYGTDYLTRALVAQIGLGANTVEKALYPTADRDSRGRLLDGAHDYVVHFAPGRLPPVRQFWSLTLYDQRILFHANPLDRFALGDRSSALRKDRDGGLTIYVSHRDPGAARRANWLPAPGGRFSLYLRLYEPEPAASANRWRPPSIRRTR
jgi:hypothetical protein